jgi:uncharacterized protein (UPF0218 family)
MHCGFDESLVIAYRVNENTRTRMKHPFGQLLAGPPEETTRRLAEIIARENPRKVVAVGDVVSHWMKYYGIEASVYVVDRRTLRKEIDVAPVEGLKEVVIRNPPGEITEEAFYALKEALDSEERVVIRVKGEEDLLALPAAMLAAIGSMIVYGQPLVGLVVIRVTPESRHEVRELLESMKVPG